MYFSFCLKGFLIMTTQKKCVSLILVAIIAMIPLVLFCGCPKRRRPSPKNTPPSITLSSLSGVQTGAVGIAYLLFDLENNAVSIAVEFSQDNGAAWKPATQAGIGDGTEDLEADASGVSHVFFWDTSLDNVGILEPVNDIIVRITPSDTKTGTPGETSAFTVDNTETNAPPTVEITTGPAEGDTVNASIVKFSWTGADVDGEVVEYYYSFDQDPPNVRTTNTSATSASLSNGSHTFRVIAVDNASATSDAATRTFTVQSSGENQPPTATILTGPAAETADNTPTFTYEGEDADGQVTGYYVSINVNPPDEFTNETTWTSPELADGEHSFYVMAQDNDGANSAVVSRDFTINTAEPTLNCTVVATFETPSSVWGIDVKGTYAYVLSSSFSTNDNMYIIDISNPEEPENVGIIVTGIHPIGVYVEGDHAFVASDNGLDIINVSDPAAPSLVSTKYNTEYKAVEVFVKNNIAYVTMYKYSPMGGYLDIVNISDIEHPETIGTYDTNGSGPYGITVIGSYAYMAKLWSGDVGFDVLDVSMPSSPELLGSYNASSVTNFTVRDTLAYLGTGNGLDIVDISDPENITLVGACSIEPQAFDVDVSGNYAFAVNYGKEFVIIDISDVSDPQIVDTVTDTEWGLNEVVVQGKYAYVADERGRLVIFRIFE
jgi:hypothetical protein